MNSPKPSIAIFRPALNIDAEQLGVLRDVLEAHDLSSPAVNVSAVDDDNRGLELNASFLSPGEFRMLQDMYFGDLGEDEVDKFADYLTDNIPPSFDQSIVVPTFPAEIYANRRRAMADRRTILLGKSQNLITEREIVQDTLAKYAADNWSTTICA